MARKSSSKRIPAAVVGVGGMGSGHCQQMKSKVREMKLVAVCDIDRAAAEAAATRFKVPCFLSHKELIKAGICEAVTIATPHPEHTRVAIDCMNAGLHALCEKPLAETISAAEKMVRTARKNRVVLAAMFQRRFEPAFGKALELVRAGKIGKVMRATMISPEYRSQAYYDSGTWRATWTGEGGGVMLNQSPHIIDIFVHLAGVPEIVRGNVETRLHNIEVEDFAEATMKFKGGGTGYFYCSTNEPGPGQMIEIFGDKGKLLFRNGNLSFIEYKSPVSIFTRKNKEMWATPPGEEVDLKIKPKASGHYSVMRNFARHIRNRKEPLLCSGESGLASLELANAITLSSFAGKDVKMPLSRKAYDALLAKLRRTSRFKKVVKEQKRVTDPHHKK